ncbi:MAG: proprotein convertase P-domain-containing protein [Acidobacteriota bacterium]
MMRRLCCAVLFVLPLLVAVRAEAQIQSQAVAVRIEAAKGVDSRVDYASLVRIGPWDDRNYSLTREDLALLAPDESAQLDPIPAFFRVELRRTNPGMPRTGEPQYPRSALQIFFLRHGGFLVDGLLYQRAIRSNGAFVVLKERKPTPLAEWEALALTGDVRVTSPNGGAESAVKINPLDSNKVVGGANGPGSGQKMFYSTNGGTTWINSAALPLGSTCCDPAVDWSSDGTKAYTATLGGCGSLCNVWVYRSGDGGATWNDLETVTPGDPRRELTAANTSDKEYIHVDKFGTSPRRDNVYLCWHDNNTLKFSRSTDFGNTWSAALTMSSGSTQSGIGCDLVTDKNGNVYYFWPATNGKTILSRKSTDGGASFAAAVTVANTQDGYDFAIPAMETRRAFIYASADADLSSGAFANRVYVAWTDTTAAESGTAANNHARIQVAFSDNGTTWTVRTPHETADASTVDRFHPWVGVSPDGTVHVMYYDTRQNAARTSVDMYYSKSTDGGNTWSAPVRATSATSPHIEDTFQWGDYNGLDADATGAIGIFTDNRNESSGSADSVDVYAAAAPGGGGCTPPAPPTGVTATPASQTQINVSWTASSGATSYNILRSTTSGGPYSLAGTSATTSFSDTGLTCNTTYYYVVQAVGGCTSGNSAQASATTNACSGGGNQVLTFSSSPALAIPDNNTTGVTSTINVPNSMTITSVSVNVGITHTFQGDLEVALIGPDNTTVLLHNRTGGGTDNINTTYNITTRSAQALTAFNGKNTSGAWKLRVRDLASSDTGTLNSWKVTFNGYSTLTAGTAIPDNNTTGITSTINVAATGTIVSLRVRVDITHTFQGDLEVSLIGPDNTTILLHNRTGSGTDNIQTVYADLTAPNQSLSAFTGKSIAGAWKLKVRDLASADTGTLNFWEIDFRTN